MPLTCLWFLLCPVTYLMEYVFTFTLCHGIPRRPHYIRIQPIVVVRGTRHIQTDGRTDTGSHFIVPPPYEGWWNYNLYFIILQS